METRIRLKNLYLIAVIAIGLIGLGVGSTFAMFTAQATINGSIVFNSNLSSTNVLAETIEVTVPAGEDKYVDLVISNTSGGNINYSTWYSPSSNDLEVGSSSSNNSYSSTGTITSADNFTLTVELRNNGDSPITVTIGVSSSSGAIILPNGGVSVPATALSLGLSSIEATFSQGSSTIYDNASLDSLKQYLTVEANYTNGSTTTLLNTDYTLSGNLAVGTSVITATYGGLTDTFNVTVTSTYLYTLENANVPISPKISTGVDLISTDMDFSICFDANVSTKNGAYKLLYHWENASPWRGLTVGRSNTTSETFTFKYIETTTQLTGITASTLTSIKFVITHQAGSGVAKIYYRANGATTTTTKTVGNSFVSLTPLSGGLSFGYHTADNNWEGTINRAYVRSFVLTASQAESFITGP